MEIEVIRRFFGWSCVFHLIMMLYWGFIILFFQDFVYKMHGRWCHFTREQFSNAHYIGLMAYKILALTFAFIPYFALRILA